MTIPAELSRSEYAAYAFLGLSALLLVAVVENEKRETLDAARAHYEEINRGAVADVVTKVENNFRQIHQGLRTLARLPGVRAIDRYGKSFSDDARTSAQEIYNNLAENVAVSEVYIVPAQFDPDKIDPATGRPQEPITEFDDLIVGRTADQRMADARGRAASHNQIADVEEIEIHEYRLMKRQIEVFKAHYPDESRVSYTSYPAIAGEQVMTCDNTRFSPSRPNDEDRMGLVYSVPFYGPDGSMRGIISAVILTAAIREMIPGGIHAIANPAYAFVAGSSDNGIWRRKLGAISAGRPAADLLYSTVRSLDIADLTGNWRLWTGLPDSRFWWSTAAVAARDKALLREVMIGVLLVLLCILTRLVIVRQRSMEQRTIELEAHVQQRTLALAQAKGEAEDANLAKSRFLANISHEIRTPLSAVTGMADLLLQSRLGSSQTKQLDIIRNAGRALTELIGQILDISAIESGRIVLQPQPSSLKGITDDIVGLFEERAHGKGIELGCRLDPRLPDKILVDTARLRQILINLVGNAIKFTESGSVSISAKLDRSPEAGRQSIWFEVSDTGIGIEPGARSDLFDPFRQANDQVAMRYGGTGLGLSISKALIDRMGGTLDFESLPGRGSTFYFTIEVERLPDDIEITAEAGIDQEANGKDPHPSLAGLNVLLAEDNLAMQVLMHEVLEQAGCRVSIAENGHEAIRLHERGCFQMILMDCRMPEMDGYEATRAIRKREKRLGLKSVPILALTANAFDADRKACLEAGMTDFVSKPFNARQIVDLIAANLVGDRTCEATNGAEQSNTAAPDLGQNASACSKHEPEIVIPAETPV